MAYPGVMTIDVCVLKILANHAMRHCRCYLDWGDQPVLFEVFVLQVRVR